MKIWLAFAQVWTAVSALGIVAALHINPNFNGPRLERVTRDLQVLRAIGNAYLGEHGQGPLTMDLLVEAKLIERLPVDPWGHAYQFIQVGEEFWPLSAGPDGDFGTTDDVTLALVTAAPAAPTDHICWY